jgi:homoserine dehydrogenase
MSRDPLHLAIVGLGNVGTGVAKILLNEPERMIQRSGRPVRLVKAVVKNLDKPQDIELPAGVLTDDVQAVIRDPHIQVACELVGGIHPAKEIILDLLAAGKDVVTANKALLCQHGDEIFDFAKKQSRTVCFEAAVAGGIPIIAAVGQSMAANQIVAIQAILNGTSNFILTEMLLKHQSYADALREAQALGYAEADPTLDVNGMDAAQKLGILAQLAFGTKVATSQIHVSGIDTLEQTDIQYAAGLGYTIKLLATAKVNGDRLELGVRPTLVHKDKPLAQIHGPYNAILLEGDVVGSVWYSGRGAGQQPTASAVTADVIDLAIGRAQLTFQQLDLWNASPRFTVAPEAETRSRYYMRLSVEDRPHVMADVTDVLGRHAISLATVIQPEAPETENGNQTQVVPLVIMTHRTSRGSLLAAESELGKLSSVRQPIVLLAVAD